MRRDRLVALTNNEGRQRRRRMAVAPQNRHHRITHHRRGVAELATRPRARHKVSNVALVVVSQHRLGVLALGRHALAHDRGALGHAHIVLVRLHTHPHAGAAGSWSTGRDSISICASSTTTPALTSRTRVLPPARRRSRRRRAVRRHRHGASSRGRRCTPSAPPAAPSAGRGAPAPSHFALRAAAPAVHRVRSRKA